MVNIDTSSSIKPYLNGFAHTYLLTFLLTSSKKVVLDNTVLEKYNLKKGKYYLEIDIRHFVSNENSPYILLKRRFYYKR